MIEEAVLHLASEYHSYLSSISGSYPQFAPDFTYPSVGVIDLITYHLRNKKTLEHADYRLINCASAYLAGITHDVWTSFSEDLQVDVIISSAAQDEIIITARGGDLLGGGKTFSVPISHALTQILQSPPNPFHFFETFSRSISNDHNLISLFASGLFAGLCPFGKGPWKDISINDADENMYATHLTLAESSAAYYNRVFPGEPLGNNPDLYLRHIFLPPTGYDEPFPSCRATLSLAEHLIHENASLSDINTLATNLASSPDEAISQAGFALAIATITKANDKASAVLKAIAEAKRTHIHELRPAIMLARKALELPHDWILLAQENNYLVAETLINIEKAYGLLPYLTLPSSFISNPDLLPLFNAIAWSNQEVGIGIINDLTSKNITNPELILQNVCFQLTTRNLSAAEEELAIFINYYNETNFAHMYKALRLQALISMAKHDNEAAARILKKALSMTINNPQDFTDISNDYALSLIMCSKFSEAVDVTTKAISTTPESVPSKLNRICALRCLGRNEDATRDIAELGTYASMDRRVFANLLTDIFSQA